MKRLLLSSRGSYITDGACGLFDRPRNELRWAYVMTASKSVPDRTYIELHQKRMDDLGWNYDVLDLDGKTPDQLRAILSDKDAINMEGGNAFYLIRSIRQSGFTQVLHEFLQRGGIYCGASAGSYVACPTMETATWKIPQRFDRHGVTDFTAMNLVPFLIVAHVTPEIEEMVRPKMEQAKYPVKLLSDRQALQVRDDEVELLKDTNVLPKELGG
ncbi:MAG: Type 1 glutamine amidotransferase-like domain-containing protein [Patescibacteria group bacterium]